LWRSGRFDKLTTAYAQSAERGWSTANLSTRLLLAGFAASRDNAALLLLDASDVGSKEASARD
jgi:hypothetical protein